MLTLYFTCSFRLKFATNNSSSGSWSADTAEAGRRSLCALCMTCPHPAAGTKYSTSMGWFRYRFLSGRRGIDNAKLVKCGCLTVDYIRLGLGGWLWLGWEEWGGTVFMTRQSVPRTRANCHVTPTCHEDKLRIWGTRSETMWKIGLLGAGAGAADRGDWATAS